MKGTDGGQGRQRGHAQSTPCQARAPTEAPASSQDLRHQGGLVSGRTEGVLGPAAASARARARPPREQDAEAASLTGWAPPPLPPPAWLPPPRRCGSPAAACAAGRAGQSGVSPPARGPVPGVRRTCRGAPGPRAAAPGLRTFRFSLQITYSLPRRFTMRQASHSFLIAERTRMFRPNPKQRGRRGRRRRSRGPLQGSGHAPLQARRPQPPASRVGAPLRPPARSITPLPTCIHNW